MSLLQDRDVDPEYYIKWIAPELYTIAKFLGTKQPSEVYTIRKMRCDCLGRGSEYRPCKHIKMLQQWISAGRPFHSTITNQTERIEVGKYTPYHGFKTNLRLLIRGAGKVFYGD